MTGLRVRARDRELPATLGEPELCPPETARVADWIGALMLRADAAPIAEVSWEYARWKPGVSMTCTYDVRYVDGASDLVVAKRYADGKDRHLEARPLRGEHWHTTSPRLVPRARVREASTALFVHAADRELPGLPTLLQPRRAAKFLRDTDVVAAGLVRRRRLAYELARYKPERRAVYHLDVRLRDAARSRLALAARVLPPADALRVAASRASFEARASEFPAPGLLGSVERYGVLFEPWLELSPYAPDSFAHRAVAGELLGRLHTTPAPRANSPTPAPDIAGAQALLERIEPALRRGPLADAPPPTRSTWCHGDFHPDQIGRDGNGEHVLLDLDALGVGDPVRDLASWIADALVEGAADDVTQESRPLLEAYRAAGGGEVAPEELRARCGEALVQRAAAALRRVEIDAVRRARQILELASGLLH